MEGVWVYNICFSYTVIFSGEYGSVVIGIRPVTKRSLVQTLLWSLDVVFVHLDKALFIYIVSVHPTDIGYLHTWGLTCDGLVSCSGESMTMETLCAYMAGEKI